MAQVGTMAGIVDVGTRELLVQIVVVVVDSELVMLESTEDSTELVGLGRAEDELEEVTTKHVPYSGWHPAPQ